MPVTPVTELLLRPRWVKSTAAVWQPSLRGATDQWKGFLFAMLATYVEATPRPAVDTSLSASGNDVGGRFCQ
jgi:hypothetical protein